jgi:DNA ligase-1
MKATFKPMLAASMDADKGQSIATLPYPMIASIKYDGIRCVIPQGGVPLTRALKNIPNNHIREELMGEGLDGLDGELMTGGEGQPFDTGPIMRRDGYPDFKFYVFDDFSDPNLNYEQRIVEYWARVTALKKKLPWLVPVSVTLVRSPEELTAFLDECLAAGHEGAMVRLKKGLYKFGRATYAEGSLIKVKPFEDAEATVVGFEEQLENTNEKTTNELGRGKRSSHQAGKVPKETLGALILHSQEFGEFRCGTGMDDALRKQIWNNMTAYFGKTVTFRFQRIGMKDKPRIPSFKGFRHKDDI